MENGKTRGVRYKFLHISANFTKKDVYRTLRLDMDGKETCTS